MQKKYINNLELTGKNKYKSLIVFDNYFKSKDKHLAEQVFWNTI